MPIINIERIFRVLVIVVAVAWTSFLFHNMVLNGQTSTSVLADPARLVVGPAGPSEHLSVEDLKPDEQKDLDAARKQLLDVEARIRKGHGEAVRDYTGGSTTADCKGAETIVEVREAQVLIRTLYAGRGDNPPCF
jgi:hypothetical protein